MQKLLPIIVLDEQWRFKNAKVEKKGCFLVPNHPCVSILQHMLAIQNWKPGNPVPRLTIETCSNSVSPTVPKTRSVVTNETSSKNANVASALEHQCAALISARNICRINHSTTSTNGGTTTRVVIKC